MVFLVRHASLPSPCAVYPQVVGHLGALGADARSDAEAVQNSRHSCIPGFSFHVFLGIAHSVRSEEQPDHAPKIFIFSHLAQLGFRKSIVHKIS